MYVGGVEGDVGNEQPIEGHNVYVTQILVDTHTSHSVTTLKSFLIFLVERDVVVLQRETSYALG